MKTVLWGLVLIFFAVPAAALVPSTPAPDLGGDPIYGTPPPSSVKNWIRLNVLGDRNAPTPIIWIAAQDFERSILNGHVILPADKYQRVAEFVQSTTCPGFPSDYPQEQAFQATEYASGHPLRFCTMPHRQACEFLSEMQALPISWTRSQIHPIEVLALTFHCHVAEP